MIATKKQNNQKPTKKYTMSSDLNISHRHTDVHVHRENNCHSKEKSNFDLLINVIEKISAIALGAFSLYTNWQLFVPFFFVGTCVGIYSYIQDKKSCHEHNPASSCAHGLLEQLTGVKLPPIISLVANIAVTVCHIDHHATVFVPVIGVSLGNWIGKTASHYGVLAYKNISANLSNKPTMSNFSFG